MKNQTYESRMLEKAQALREKGHALILAVESSCDETAIAIVEDGRIERANAIASQIDVHALYGGVVPEIASRMHVEAIDPLLERALSEAGVTLEDIDAIAVTYGPGLVGSSAAVCVPCGLRRTQPYRGRRALRRIQADRPDHGRCCGRGF